jgi:hypothetical protein
MKHKTTKNFSLLIIVISLIAFIYISVKAFGIVQKTQISTSDGIYTNRVTTSEEIKAKAFELTKKCQSELCEVQSVLDYVTYIPYKINHFQAHSPQRTIQLGFGDCDDKSNLLISMLHALEKEAYFVLVPKHIFVIMPIEDKRLKETKGLWVDKKKYFILESTAKGSSVGFPLHYKLDEINIIVDPFINEKHSFKQISWR